MEESDPLQWELDQLDKLDHLAARYGWSEDCKEYLTRVKLIQAQSVGRQRALSRRTPAAGVAASGREAVMAAISGGSVDRRPKPTGWSDADKPAKRCKGWEAAKASLLGDPPFGAWRTDRDAPSGNNWRRFISVDADNPKQYARVRIYEGPIPPTLPMCPTLATPAACSPLRVCARDR